MKVLSFRASGIHGYLSLNIDFDPDLTFLTGINGAGKSTVVHSIVALISPSLAILGRLDFTSMKLLLEHDAAKLSITAAKVDGKITISVSGQKKPFSFAVFQSDSDEPPARQAEREADYYETLSLAASEHPAIAAIEALPTPMFLDLDRRAIATEDDRRTYFLRRRRERNIFSASLNQSLVRAAALIDRENRKLQGQLREVNDKYRTELILSLLSVSAGQFAQITLPKQSDLKKLDRVRTALPEIPRLLDVPGEQIEQRLTPFIKQMESYAKTLEGFDSVHKVFEKTSEPNSPEGQAILQWSANVPQIKRISENIDIVEKHNAECVAAGKKMNSYLVAVNKFLRDSRKELCFDELGYVSFKIIGSVKTREITSLSSGEAQIFVLLTHLYYNSKARMGNVFIIDEPELSLHVAWQEMFVDSIVEANPGVQFILATHSPTIILERIRNCRDMGALTFVEPGA